MFKGHRQNVLLKVIDKMFIQIIINFSKDIGNV